MKTAKKILFWCGCCEVVVGSFLFILMLFSFVASKWVLEGILGLPPSSIDSLAANSWAQTAIAFGMHSYVDIATGLEMMAIGSKRGSSVDNVPATVTVWNTTLFAIRFIWVVVLMKGFIFMSESHGVNFLQWPPSVLGLLLMLALDAVLVRPAAVWAQR